MTPLKFYIGLGVALILALAISAFGTHYFSLRADAAQGALDKAKVQTTTDNLKDGAEASADRDRVDTAVSLSRAEYERLLEEAMQNDPELRDRDVRPVPDQLRDLARQRRIERERSAGTEAKRVDGNAKPSAAER